MRKKLLVLSLLGLLLFGGYLYAANGDLIVEGNFGVGYLTPVPKMQVNATNNGNSAAFDGSVVIGPGMGGSDASNADMLIVRSTTMGTGHHAMTIKNYGNQILMEIRDDGQTILGGKLGIGTSSPAQMLSVGGTIQSMTGGVMYPDGTTQTTAYRIPATDLTDVGGNIGIGTSTPAQKLSVAGVIQSTTGGVMFPDGSVQTTAAQGSHGLLNVRYLTTVGAGVYTPTAGTQSIIVDLVGGGGAGQIAGPISSAQLSMGASGGSGGYARKRFTGITGTYVYSVGAGGSTSGATGGNTTFTGPGAVTVTAYGGAGGPSGAGGTSVIILNGGAGGSISTNGDINAGGNPGALSCAQNTMGASGPGGASVFGGAGKGVSVTAYQTTPGSDATGYGSGGSGAIGWGSGPLVQGGAGKQGIIIVYEYN